MKLDPTAAADDLDIHAAALEKALGKVETEKREAQITQSAKDAAMSRWPTVYSGVATATAGLFTLANRPELADRVKPTAKLRAGLLEAEDQSAPENPPAAPPGTPG